MSYFYAHFAKKFCFGGIIYYGVVIYHLVKEILMSNKKQNTLALSAVAIVVFSLLGKVMGFGREMLMSYIYGAGTESDAFIAALKTTSILSIPIQSAIATTFIPMLSLAEEQEGLESRDHHTNNMLILSATFAIITAVIGMIFAPQLVHIMAKGFEGEVFDLTVTLTRIGMPVIFFAAIVGVLTGFLHHEGRFAAAGAVAVPLNIVYIGYMLLLSRRFGIYGMSVASVLGVAAQILLLYPDTKKAGLKYFWVFDPTDQYVKYALVLAVPTIISVAVNDINIAVNNRIASQLVVGSISWLNYSNKLNIFVLGVFISAITAVVFPVMSRAFSTGDMEGGKDSMSSAVRMIILITIPSMIGLTVLSDVIVDIAFGRGAFTDYDVMMTASALRFYSIGLPAMSMNTLLNRVSYSLHDTRTPLYLGGLSVVLNIIFSLTFVYVLDMGHNGLALGLALGTTISVLVFFSILNKKLDGIDLGNYVVTFVKTLVAALIMGVATRFSYNFVAGRGFDAGARQLLPLLVSVVVAMVVYGTVVYILGNEELDYAKDKIIAKFKK